MRGLLDTVFGLPMFCVPSWFLLMIFSVELVHYGVFRFLKTDAHILMAAAVFYAAGYMLNWQIDFFNPMKGRVVGWNFLFFHEAIPMYAFYLMGVYLQRKEFFKQKAAPMTLAAGIAITFLIVLFTYQLNTGSFSFAPLDAVAIMLSSHGHFIWFPITAIAGSCMILFIAQATPVQRTLLWMGPKLPCSDVSERDFLSLYQPPGRQMGRGALIGDAFDGVGSRVWGNVGEVFFFACP